jgi:hypothetical protein
MTLASLSAVSVDGMQVMRSWEKTKFLATLGFKKEGLRQPMSSESMPQSIRVTTNQHPRFGSVEQAG